MKPTPARAGRYKVPAGAGGRRDRPALPILLTCPVGPAFASREIDFEGKRVKIKD